jgi:uncharacterized protein (DUF1330 family)
MHLNPSRAQFDAFKALPRDEPCHMLNLVALRPAAAYPPDHSAAAEALTGAQAYARYGELTRPIFEGVGGRILWSVQPRLNLIGPEPPAEAWDIAFIAAYPSAAAFLRMVTDPAYQAAVVHRTAAVADSRLIRCAPREGAGGFG